MGNEAPERQIKSFQDLKVWKLSRELRRELTALAKRLPKEEQFRLTDQIIRAARSVTANLAEGYGRHHFKENIQFCRQSRGSLYEIVDHLTVCLDDGFIEQSEFERLKDSCEQATKLLNGYIRFLNKQREASNKST